MLISFMAAYKIYTDESRSGVFLEKGKGSSNLKLSFERAAVAFLEN
jgi:hypothetical protein